MVISAIQRGIFTPKRFVCQHRKPPMKELILASNMAIYILLRPPQKGPDFSTNSE